MSWEQWWYVNQEAVLAALRTPPPPGSDVRPVDARTIGPRIVPALRDLAFRDDVAVEVRAAAVVALGRAGDAPSAPALRTMAASCDEEQVEQSLQQRQLAESATLALGLLEPRDAATRTFLIDRMRAPDPRRRFERQFAAVGLGLLSTGDGPDRVAARVLSDAIAVADGDSHVRPAFLVALGLIADETALSRLIGLLHGDCAPDSAPLTDAERAFAVEALGRFRASDSAGTAFREAAALVERRRDIASLDVRLAATVALGRLGGNGGPCRQSDAAALLCALAEDGATDESERRAALTSVGVLAATPGTEPALRSKIAAFLLRRMQDSPADAAPFAALALALVVRDQREASGCASEDGACARIRLRFISESDASLRGAYAVASAIAGDRAAVAPLRAVFADAAADKRSRGWCAVALGMLGDTESREALCLALGESEAWDFVGQCATGLGLLRDPQAIGELVRALDDHSTYCERSIAHALELLGDERVVAPLLAVAADASSRTRRSRALAINLLGRLADCREVPVLARIGTEFNYRCDPAITELLTLL